MGLAPPEKPEDLMSPDTHTPGMAVRPSVADLKSAKLVQAARVKLMDYAAHKTAIYLPRPIMAVEKVEIDAGDVWRGDAPKFVFNIKNTGDAPLEIFAKPNCGCTVANFDKLIAPGSSGKVEAAVNTAAFRGKIYKTINLTSNDPENPKSDLRLLANVKSIMSVLPSETPLIGLKDTEPTTNELTVKIEDKEPVQISKVTCSVPYATADVEPVSDQ